MSTDRRYSGVDQGQANLVLLTEHLDTNRLGFTVASHAGVDASVVRIDRFKVQET